MGSLGCVSKAGIYGAIFWPVGHMCTIRSFVFLPILTLFSWANYPKKWRIRILLYSIRSLEFDDADRPTKKWVFGHFRSALAITFVITRINFVIIEHLFCIALLDPFLMAATGDGYFNAHSHPLRPVIQSRNYGGIPILSRGLVRVGRDKCCCSDRGQDLD